MHRDFSFQSKLLAGGGVGVMMGERDEVKMKQMVSERPEVLDAALYGGLRLPTGQRTEGLSKLQRLEDLEVSVRPLEGMCVCVCGGAGEAEDDEWGLVLKAAGATVVRAEDSFEDLDALIVDVTTLPPLVTSPPERVAVALGKAQGVAAMTLDLSWVVSCVAERRLLEVTDDPRFRVRRDASPTPNSSGVFVLRTADGRRLEVGDAVEMESKESTKSWGRIVAIEEGADKCRVQMMTLHGGQDTLVEVEGGVGLAVPIEHVKQTLVLLGGNDFRAAAHYAEGTCVFALRTKK